MAAAVEGASLEVRFVEPSLDLASLAACLADAVTAAGRRCRLPSPRLGSRSGRAPAGWAPAPDGLPPDGSPARRFEQGSAYRDARERSQPLLQWRPEAG